MISNHYSLDVNSFENKCKISILLLEIMEDLSLKTVPIFVMFLGRKFRSKSHTQFSVLLRRRLFFLVLWQRLLCSLFFVGQKKRSCSTKKKRFLRRRTKIKLFVGVEKWVATSLLPKVLLFSKKTTTNPLLLKNNVELIEETVGSDCSIILSNLLWMKKRCHCQFQIIPKLSMS